MSNTNEKKRKAPGLKSHITTQKAAPAYTTLAKARSVDVVQFVESRSFEINALQKSLDDARNSGNLRAFQTLPRHLRRRAASHNVKRIPARLREKAIAEMAKSAQTSKTLGGGTGGKLTNAKRSSRYKRRRARTVREEYELRQTSKRWLETHVWHAKRMRMKELWGTMIATTPNERSHRAAYRAAMEKTYIQDISYFRTIELKGAEQSIIDALTNIVAPDINGVCLTRQTYLSGGRLASLTMYRSGQYPRGMLGPAMALWKPKSDEDHGSDRILWLRIHPAMSTAVLAELGGAKSAAVQVTDVSSELVSFELLGSQSTKALAAVLSHSVAPSTTGSNILQFIKGLPCPEVLPEGIVLALHIHDPRLHFPFELPSAADAKLPEQQLQQLNGLLLNWPKDAASFGDLDGIWDREQCAKDTESRPSEHALNQRRHEQLVPGTKLDPIPATDVTVPVLLIRTGPGSMVGSRVTNASNNQVVGNLAHGWTVIAPRGWGMALWMALQFVGARAQGLDERAHVGFEAGLPTFPGNWPGTDAFDEWVGVVATDEYDRWSHRPPGKRTNYLQFGIDTPFFPDFYRLLGIKGSLPEAYPTLAADDLECRVKRLRKIRANKKNSDSAMDLDTTSASSGQIWLASGERVAQAIKAMLSLEPSMPFLQWSKPLLEAALILPRSDGNSSECQELLGNCLVRVRLICRGRGTPAKNAPVCYIGEQSTTIGYVMTGSFSLARGCGMAVGACSLRGLFGLWQGRKDLELKKCPDVSIKALDGGPCFEAVLSPLP